MESAIETTPLAICAALNLEGPGGSIEIRGEHDRIVARADRLPALAAALALANRGASTGRCARTAHRLLSTAGLTIELRLRDRRVARLGQRARANRLARLLGMDGLELGWPVLLVWLRAIATSRRRD
jgi:hypothetical protein